MYLIGIYNLRPPSKDSPIKWTHLSGGQPYRAVPKATETGLKTTPEDTLRMVPKRLGFRASSGAVSPDLGPALQGCPLDRCVHLTGESF